MNIISKKIIENRQKKCDHVILVTKWEFTKAGGKLLGEFNPDFMEAVEICCPKCDKDF